MCLWGRLVALVLCVAPLPAARIGVEVKAERRKAHGESGRQALQSAGQRLGVSGSEGFIGKAHGGSAVEGWTLSLGPARLQGVLGFGRRRRGKGCACGVGAAAAGQLPPRRPRLRAGGCCQHHSGQEQQPCCC